MSRLAGLIGPLFRTTPTTSGWLSLSGPEQRITVHRDGYGIPHIYARSDHDAWFGLGFCQGQDRSFQLELRRRTVRGTLSELVGASGLAIDRLSRRIGFRPASLEQEQRLAPDVLHQLAAFVGGMNAAFAAGAPRPQPEFQLLRARPTPWDAADVIGMGKLMSFLLIGNWDAEMARLKILLADGPQALADLNPTYPAELPVSSPPGGRAGPALDRLSADLAAFLAASGTGGGSNNWAVAGSRTLSGRPILANDTHLDPALPPHWYLAHVRAPDWALAGGALVGTPAFGSGHNGFAAWGITAGLTDTTDLFLEEIAPDGASVRSAEGFVPCQVREETINIRGRDPVVERVSVTPRGPVISPALEGGLPLLSLSAVWLQPRPARGFLQLHRVRSLEEFRARFNEWPLLSQNVCYADVDGNIAWQLVGEVPQRLKGWGTLPQPGWDPEAGWREETVPLGDMPFAVNPADGIVASANNQPVVDGRGPFLGVDWLDGFRAARIHELLDRGRAWDIESSLRLQMDDTSPAWAEIRDAVLQLPVTNSDMQTGLALLSVWDGSLAPSSSAATVYEMFLAEAWRRLGALKAPNSWRWALGQGFAELLPLTTFAAGRTSRLLNLIRGQPDGWVAAGWNAFLAEALTAAVREISRSWGKDPAGWAWGEVRRITFQHPLGRIAALAPVFNRGPYAWGGDGSTISQAGTTPLRPTGNPLAVAALRMVVEAGDWDQARFSLPGGQSGNPFSPHYDDLLPHWLEGGAVALAFSAEAVRRATRESLDLLPLADAAVHRPA